MKELEEDNNCSGGFCVDEPLPIYVFSNVNDGVPEQSCHEAVSDMVISNVNGYLIGFAIPLAECCVVVGAYCLLILWACFGKCFRKKAKGEKEM